ncbi:MAG: hypothetical protein ACK5NQ_11330 [Pseudomonas sp.]
MLKIEISKTNAAYPATEIQARVIASDGLYADTVFLKKSDESSWKQTNIQDYSEVFGLTKEKANDANIVIRNQVDTFVSGNKSLGFNSFLQTSTDCKLSIQISWSSKENATPEQ